MNPSQDLDTLIEQAFGKRQKAYTYEPHKTLTRAETVSYAERLCDAKEKGGQAVLPYKIAVLEGIVTGESYVTLLLGMCKALSLVLDEPKFYADVYGVLEKRLRRENAALPQAAKQLAELHNQRLTFNSKYAIL